MELYLDTWVIVVSVWLMLSGASVGILWNLRTRSVTVIAFIFLLFLGAMDFHGRAATYKPL